MVLCVAVTSGTGLPVLMMCVVEITPGLKAGPGPMVGRTGQLILVDVGGFTPPEPCGAPLLLVSWLSSAAQQTLNTIFMLFAEQRPPTRRCKSSLDDVAVTNYTFLMLNTDRYWGKSKQLFNQHCDDNMYIVVKFVEINSVERSNISPVMYTSLNT